MDTKTAGKMGGLKSRANMPKDKMIASNRKAAALSWRGHDKEKAATGKCKCKQCTTRSKK